MAKTCCQKNMTEDDRIEQFAFESFCYFHPNEAYAKYPERFWAFFQQEWPNFSREQMEQALKDTDEP